MSQKMMSFTIGKSTHTEIAVRPLKADRTLKDAETILKNSKDGWDTIGFTFNGKDYLATGYGLNDPKGKEVTWNGKKVDVKFFENENNTILEGSWGAVKSTAGVASAAIVGLSGGAFFAIGDGIGTGILNIGSALITGGRSMPFVTSTGMSFLKGAVIGATATAGVAALVGAVKGGLTSGNEAVLNTLAGPAYQIPQK